MLELTLRPPELGSVLAELGERARSSAEAATHAWEKR